MSLAQRQNEDDELQSIVDTLFESGGAPRSARRRLKELLASKSADAREIFIRRAFDQAGRQVDGETRKVVQGLRKLIDALLESEGRRLAVAGIAEAHFSPGDAARDRITDLTDGARATLDCCVFSITDDRISNALLRAHERGGQGAHHHG